MKKAKKIDDFYEWYLSRDPYDLLEMANNEKDKNKRQFLYDLVNSRIRINQEAIVKGKFVM